MSHPLMSLFAGRADSQPPIVAVAAPSTPTVGAVQPTDESTAAPPTAAGAIDYLDSILAVQSPPTADGWPGAIEFHPRLNLAERRRIAFELETWDCGGRGDGKKAGG